MYLDSYIRLSKHVRRYVDKLYNNHDNVRKELEKRKINLDYREKTANIEYDKLKADFEKRQNELKDSFEKKTEKLRQDCEREKAENEQELEEAIKEAEGELKTYIDTVDNLIEDKITDLTLKNTLTFDCVCGKKNIPCFIDLTKENTFRCDKCNSVYAIHAKFSPVIVGRASSEEEFARIVEERMQEEQGDE